MDSRDRQQRVSTALRAAQSTTYCAEERQLRKTTSTSGDGSIYRSYEYTPLGDLRQVTVSGDGLSGSVSTSWRYDAHRNVRVVTYPLGYTDTYTYDSRNVPTQVPRSDGGGWIYFEHDGNGNRTSVSSPRNASWKTTMDYDGHDRVKSVTSPVGTTTSYTYTPADCCCRRTRRAAARAMTSRGRTTRSGTR